MEITSLSNLTLGSGVSTELDLRFLFLIVLVPLQHLFNAHLSIPLRKSDPPPAPPPAPAPPPPAPPPA